MLLGTARFGKENTSPRPTAAMRVSHIERVNPLIIICSNFSASQFPAESSFSARIESSTIHGCYIDMPDFKRSFQCIQPQLEPLQFC